MCLHFSTGGAAHCTRSHQGMAQHSSLGAIRAALDRWNQSRHRISKGSNWVCLKMLCTPLYPMVLLILIPMKMAISLGRLTQHFQTNPIGKQRHAVFVFFCWCLLFNLHKRKKCIKLTKPPWSCHRCWTPRRPRQEQRLAILGELRIRKKGWWSSYIY